MTRAIVALLVLAMFGALARWPLAVVGALILVGAVLVLMCLSYMAGAHSALQAQHQTARDLVASLRELVAVLRRQAAAGAGEFLVPAAPASADPGKGN